MTGKMQNLINLFEASKPQGAVKATPLKLKVDTKKKIEVVSRYTNVVKEKQKENHVSAVNPKEPAAAKKVAQPYQSKTPPKAEVVRSDVSVKRKSFENFNKEGKVCSNLVNFWVKQADEAKVAEAQHVPPKSPTKQTQTAFVPPSAAPKAFASVAPKVVAPVAPKVVAPVAPKVVAPVVPKAAPQKTFVPQPVQQKPASPESDDEEEQVQQPEQAQEIAQEAQVQEEYQDQQQQEQPEYQQAQFLPPPPQQRRPATPDSEEDEAENNSFDDDN